MLRLASVSLAAIAFSLAVIACGGDDDATPTPAVTITTVSSPAASTTAPADDQKTEAPSASPAAVTAAPIAPGDIPTAPPTASEGTPAVAPEDQGAFVGQFEGQPIDFEGCSYDPNTALVNCAARGRYAIDPPIVGQDISCNIWIVSGAAKIIQCTSNQPRDTTFYEIME